MTEAKAKQMIGTNFVSRYWDGQSISDVYAQQKNAEYFLQGLEQERARAKGILEGLISISKNTCCDKCQQAALVAKSVLADYQRAEYLGKRKGDPKEAERACSHCGGNRCHGYMGE